MIKENNKKGFTLVEILTAVALFTVVASFSIGAVLSIYDANRKAQSSKTIVDNLNYAVENMTRMIRFGKNYHCGTTLPLSSPLNCTGGGTSLSVTFYDKSLGRNVIVTYTHDTVNKTIMRTYDGTTDSVGITSDDTVIEYVRFFVSGTSLIDTFQPVVLVVISGYTGNKASTQTRFDIETSISQMELDVQI